jgi:hypothetical protein
MQCVAIDTKASGRLDLHLVAFLEDLFDQFPLHRPDNSLVEHPLGNTADAGPDNLSYQTGKIP